MPTLLVEINRNDYRFPADPTSSFLSLCSGTTLESPVDHSVLMCSCSWWLVWRFGGVVATAIEIVVSKSAGKVFVKGKCSVVLVSWWTHEWWKYFSRSTRNFRALRCLQIVSPRVSDLFPVIYVLWSSKITEVFLFRNTVSTLLASSGETRSIPLFCKCGRLIANCRTENSENCPPGDSWNLRTEIVTQHGFASQIFVSSKKKRKINQQCLSVFAFDRNSISFPNCPDRGNHQHTVFCPEDGLCYLMITCPVRSYLW